MADNDNQTTESKKYRKCVPLWTFVVNVLINLIGISGWLAMSIISYKNMPGSQYWAWVISFAVVAMTLIICSTVIIVHLIKATKQHDKDNRMLGILEKAYEKILK